jgi:hypothetical protein
MAKAKRKERKEKKNLELPLRGIIRETKNKTADTVQTIISIIVDVGSSLNWIGFILSILLPPMKMQ